MRAVVFRGVDRSLAVTERPVPELADGEILIKVAYCGICGSDLHAVREPAFRLPDGQILGHEFAGAVMQSRSPDWRVGDRVCVEPLRECDACRPFGGCRCALGILCPEARILGMAAGAEGAYAEYVRVGAAHALRLPDEVSLVGGALVEPLAVGVHAVHRAGPVLGQAVLVIGAGPIGLAVTIFARIGGAAHVVVSEPNAERRALAAQLGATGLIDPTCETVAADFHAIAGAAPAVIFDCAGATGLLRPLIRLAAPRARIVVVGAAANPESFVPLAALFKEIELRFALGYDRQDFRFVLDLLRTQRLQTTPLVSQIVSLDEAPAAFARLQQPNAFAKILIEPGPA